MLARMLAGAFIDDPVWTAVGPRRRPHRGLTNRLSFWAIVRACERHDARIRAARLPDEAPDQRPLGATIALDPGRWPLPDSSLAWELPWALVAGPLPVRRGLALDHSMRRGHITRPHVYLWCIGVDPERHGTGVGGALMEELHEHSDELGVATYLEASSGSNVGFYEALGYRVLGELSGRNGALLWRMERQPRQTPVAVGIA